MTSSVSASMTACNTSLPITDDSERAAVDEAKPSSESIQNNVTKESCSPITDLMQKTSALGLPPMSQATALSTTTTSTTTPLPLLQLQLSGKGTTALSTPPPTSPTSPAKGETTTAGATTFSSTSKIPYPFLYPLRQQQQQQQQQRHQRNINSSSSSSKTTTSSINQFQRSASLRLRGKNSNLLFNNINLYNNNMNMEHGKNINTRIEQNTSNTTTAAAAAAAAAETRATSAKKLYFGTHNEYPATGQISVRRKLELNSPPLSAEIGLTRSLSLRRNCRSHLKTDSLAKALSSATCSAGQASSTAGKQKDFVHRNNIDGNVEYEREAPDGGNCSGFTNGSSENPTNIMAELEAAKRESKKEVQKTMSLNLNGSATATASASAKTTTTTTSVSENGTATTTRTTAAAAAAPATAAVITPRTPKTPILVSHSKHNYHQHHHYCSTKSSPLSAVPETKLSPKTPPVTPDSPCTYLDDDLDSIYSFATTTSGRSTMSCEHPYVARNGTTFSGRKMKYVVHCSNYAGQVGPDYLTPTQRAQRHIRRLRELLNVARQDLEHKDTEIIRLTREVVELRLFKASLSSPEERSASSDAVTVREADLKTSQDVSPIIDMVDDATKTSPQHIVNAAAGHHNLNHNHHNPHHHSQQLSSDMQSSFADSGHFEDLTTSSINSKDSYAGHTHDIACGSDEAAGTSDGNASCSGGNVENYELQRQELIRIYEQKIEELIRNQDASTSEMKRSHNDKVEALLQKLAECNTRYADIVPDYEHAKERIRELEKQLEDLQRKLIEHEEKQNKMYLHMYQQGQEAERIARADQALELAHRAPNNKVSINELLHQLQSTQDELENIRAAECRSNECGSNHALLTAKEAISLWVLGARKTIYRRLLDAQKTRTHVDPEVTLQFLKSAIYYFLTDKENSQGHLQAIESILEFTEAEKLNISRAGVPK